MEELNQAFENWKSVETQEWRDDSCGETLGEFKSRMREADIDYMNDPYSWEEDLEEYMDISGY